MTAASETTRWPRSRSLAARLRPTAVPTRSELAGGHLKHLITHILHANTIFFERKRGSLVWAGVVIPGRGDGKKFGYAEAIDILYRQFDHAHDYYFCFSVFFRRERVLDLQGVF